MNLYIDFDGVVLDTITPMYKMLEEEKIDRKDSEKVVEFLKRTDYNEIIKKSPEINYSISAIKKIIDSNKFNVNILTHVVTLEEGVVKTEFIRKYFKDITMILVPKQISKTKMVHTKDSILVDDYAGNLRSWEKEGGIPVRFSTKLNSKGFKVVDNLENLIDLF